MLHVVDNDLYTYLQTKCYLILQNLVKYYLKKQQEQMLISIGILEWLINHTHSLHRKDKFVDIIYAQLRKNSDAIDEPILFKT